jgi:K+-sensing histidine kinase KdpD
MRNNNYLNSQQPLKPLHQGACERTDSYLTLVASSGFEGYRDMSAGSQESQTLCAPFFQIESKLSLMYRSIAAERNRHNDITIVNEVGKQEIRIAFPAIVFYTVMEELIENAFKFSLGKSAVIITFSEVENRLRIAIRTEGSFSRGSAETTDVVESQAPSKLSLGIGLALTNKLCKYYNSHFAIYQNMDNLIITLEIPINFK